MHLKQLLTLGRYADNDGSNQVIKMFLLGSFDEIIESFVDSRKDE